MSTEHTKTAFKLFTVYLSNRYLLSFLTVPTKCLPTAVVIEFEFYFNGLKH